MALEREQLAAGGGVPDYDARICAAGDEDGCVVKMQAEECFHEVAVSVESSAWGTCGCRPGPDGFVPAACV